MSVKPVLKMIIVNIHMNGNAVNVGRKIMQLDESELDLLWHCVFNEINRHLRNGGEPLDEKFERLDDILIKIRKEMK